MCTKDGPCGTNILLERLNFYESVCVHATSNTMVHLYTECEAYIFSLSLNSRLESPSVTVETKLIIISNLHVVTPCTCARGKVIGFVAVIIVDTKITKSGDLGT